MWHVKKDCLIWKYFKVWHFLMHNKQVEVSPEYQCQHFPLISALFFLYFESFSEYCEHKIDLSVWRKSIDLFADKSSWKCLPELALQMEFRVCLLFSVLPLSSHSLIINPSFGMYQDIHVKIIPGITIKWWENDLSNTLTRHSPKIMAFRDYNKMCNESDSFLTHHLNNDY